MLKSGKQIMGVFTGRNIVGTFCWKIVAQKQEKLLALLVNVNRAVGLI